MRLLTHFRPFSCLKTSNLSAKSRFGVLLGKKFEISFIFLVLQNFLMKIRVYGRFLFVLNSYKTVTKLVRDRSLRKKRVIQTKTPLFSNYCHEKMLFPSFIACPSLRFLFSCHFAMFHLLYSRNQNASTSSKVKSYFPPHSTSPVKILVILYPRLLSSCFNCFKCCNR